MKNLLILLLLLSLVSCGDRDTSIKCDADALFSRDESSGTMVYIPCYDVWAIELDEPDPMGETIFAASLDIAEEFKIEGLAVELDACFYTFDLPLIFPDPEFFGLLYLIEDFSILAL